MIFYVVFCINETAIGFYDLFLQILLLEYFVVNKPEEIIIT